MTRDPKHVFLLVILFVALVVTSATGQPPEAAADALPPDAAIPWGEVSNGLRCRLTPVHLSLTFVDDQRLRERDIFVTYELQNVSDAAVRFLPHFTALMSEEGAFLVISPDGEGATYSPSMSDYDYSEGPALFVTIAPGQTITKQVEFFPEDWVPNPYFPYFRVPGRYRVFARTVRTQETHGLTLKFYYGDDEARIKENPDHVWLGELVSNPVILDVTNPYFVAEFEPEWKKRLQESLQQKVSITFKDMPFDEALQSLRAFVPAVNFVIDPDLELADQRVTLELLSATIGATLRYITDLVGVHCELRDEAVWITNDGDAMRMYRHRTWQKRLRQSLQERASVNFTCSGAEEVIRFLKEAFPYVRFDVDQEAMAGVGGACVTLELKDVSLESVLSFSTEQLGLDYALRDGTVWITTPEKARTCCR